MFPMHLFGAILAKGTKMTVPAVVHHIFEVILNFTFALNRLFK